MKCFGTVPVVLGASKLSHSPPLPPHQPDKGVGSGRSSDGVWCMLINSSSSGFLQLGLMVTLSEKIQNYLDQRALSLSCFSDSRREKEIGGKTIF